VPLELPGMNDHAQRRVDCQGDAVHQAVGNANRMNDERSHAEPLVRFYLVKLCVVQQLMFFEFVLHQCECEFGGIDWNVELGENPGKPADMVLMSVREDDGANRIAILQQIGNVGNNDIYAEKLGFRKHQARVDDDDVIAPTHGHAVHSELAQTAQRYDVKLPSRHNV